MSARDPRPDRLFDDDSLRPADVDLGGDSPQSRSGVSRGPVGAPTAADSATPSQPATAADSATPGLSAEGPLSNGPLGPLDTRPGHVDLDERVADYLNARWGADEAGSFPCPLPGHSGSARLVEQGGDLRLGCCSGRWRSLGEVRAAEAYGRLDWQLTNIEIATWTRRVAYEARTFRPFDVLVPRLPDDAGAHVRRARVGFELLIGLRWADGEHRPVAFSIRFAAAWCDLAYREARLAIWELVRLGVIHEAGRRGRTPLYLPGEERP